MVTRTAAGWVHERVMHEYLSMGRTDLVIFQDPKEGRMQPSTRLLPGTLAGLKEAGANDSFICGNLPGVDRLLVIQTTMFMLFMQQLRIPTQVLLNAFEWCESIFVRRFEQPVLGTLLLSRTANRLLKTM